MRKLVMTLAVVGGLVLAVPAEAGELRSKVLEPGDDKNTRCPGGSYHIGRTKLWPIWHSPTSSGPLPLVALVRRETVTQFWFDDDAAGDLRHVDVRMWRRDQGRYQGVANLSSTSSFVYQWRCIAR